MAADAGCSGSSSRREETEECPLPSWVMLDRHVFTRLDLNSFKEDETTSPLCRTSQDDPFRVSFRLAAPPAISRFYLHVQGGNNLSDPRHSSCRILASHRNAVLFCIYVPLPVPVEYLSNPDGEPFPRFFKQDLFVYVAGNRPSLQLLPPCPMPQEDQVASQEFYDPLADIVQFWDAESLCVLHDEEKNYVVGYLCVSREITAGSGAQEVEAQLCLYYSYDSSWEMHALPIFCQREDMDALFSWSTTTALAFGTYLCWVDYQCGILFCDMSQEDLSVSYLPLPVYNHLAPDVCMEKYRSISIVQDEGVPKMMFVDVRPSHGYVNRPRPDGFEITFWTLAVEDGNMYWKDEYVLQGSELCIDKLVPTPHGPLMLPVVSMEDPHVAYFMICELGCDAKKAWVVPVDLVSKSLMYLLPYDNGEVGLSDDDADMPRKNRRQNFAPFLPSEITKFL
ncbi:unnamed protein product [Urochloa decumbens]|uniref:DUF1618 domain-containing protein n=1 Tax=Urochloa decumbens TaxID=240449 RepID=A0ABC9EZT5_9POAL